MWSDGRKKKVQGQNGRKRENERKKKESKKENQIETMQKEIDVEGNFKKAFFYELYIKFLTSIFASYF
jgi:hypothetical protein